MWLCRDCGYSQTSRSKILKHFSLVYGHYGHRHAYPCGYSYCPCTFETFVHAHLKHVYGTFKSHKSLKHSQCSMTDFNEGIVKTDSSQELRGISDDTLSNEETNTDV